MSSVDDRIVQMEFRNAQFEKGVSQTISSMKNLDESLKLNTGKIGSDVSSIASKFSAFGAIGFTALQRLTDGAIDFGKKFVANVMDPIVEGGKKRALNIEQAKFQFRGLGMDVGQSMADALYAVKDTAFGLDEAAVAASQFGASGIKSGKDMQSALRGISGVAAMAGSSYSDMANVFTKVAGQGRLMGDDLNRLGTRGINAASTLAEYLTKVGDSAKVTESDVREMVTKGQVSFKTFAAAMSDAFGEHATSANQTYTGSLSNMRAALARIGAEFATAKFERQRRVFNALTPVIDKVAAGLRPLMDLYAQIQTRSARNIEGLLSSSFVTNLVQSIGFFTQSISNLHRAARSYLVPIGEAFRSVFPAKQVTIFTRIGFAIQHFTSKLTASSATAEKVRRIFTGFFSVFKVGWDVLKGVLSLFGTVISSIFGGLSGLGGLNLSGGFLEFAASIADVATRMREWLEEGDRLNKFFESIRRGLRFVIDTLKDFGVAIGDAFRSLAQGDFSGFWNKIKSSFSELSPIIERLASPLATLMGYFEDGANYVADFFSSFGNFATDKISEVFENIGEKLSNFKDNLLDFKPKVDTSDLRNAEIDVAGFSFSSEKLKGVWEGVKTAVGNARDFIVPVAKEIGDVIYTTFKRLIDWFSGRSTGELLAALGIGSFIYFSKQFQKVSNSISGFIDSFSGIGNAIASGWGLTDYFKELQKSVKANMLIKIAVAILILAAALWVLSRIPMQDLVKGGIAMGLMFGALILTLKAMEKIDMEKLGGGMARAALGMAALGLAILFMSRAIERLGSMDTGDLVKGVVAVAALIGVLTAFTRWGNVGSMTIRAGIGLMFLAGALYLMTFPIEKFAQYKWAEIGEGLGIMATVLLGVAGALALMPADSIAKAFAIIVAAGALWLLAEALEKFGDIQNKADGLFALGYSLGALALALLAINGALPGAFAMGVAAASMWVLADALIRLSEADPYKVASAIFFLAGGLGILIAAAYLAMPVLPGLWTLAGVILAIGVAALLGGLGLKFAAQGFDIFSGALMRVQPVAEECAAALGILSDAAIENKDAILPLIGLGAGLALLGVGLILAGTGAVILGAGLMAAGLGCMFFSRYAEPTTKALRDFLDEFSVMKGDYAEMGLAAAALTALGLAFGVLGVGALAAAIGAVAIALGMAALLVVAAIFIPVMELLRMSVERFYKHMNKFIELGKAMNTFSKAAGDAAGPTDDLGSAINRLSGNIKGVDKQLEAVGVAAIEANNDFQLAATTIANRAKIWATEVVGDFDRLSTGIDKSSKEIQKSIGRLESDMKKALDKTASTVRSSRGRILREISTLTSDIASRLRSSTSSISGAAESVGRAISSGMSRGIRAQSGSVTAQAMSVARSAVNAARSVLVVASPSKVMFEIGQFFDKGFELGILDGEGDVADSAAYVGASALQALRKSIEGLDDLVDATMDLNPTITPIIDMTKLSGDAERISAIFAGQKLHLDELALRAASVAADYSNVHSLRNEQPASNVTTLSFQQTNNSPKALSPNEIYRQTKNQLSIVKEGLAI